MAIQHAPHRGTLLKVDFGVAFIEPEMVKPRLCLVISPPMKSRPGLCTVVPLSTTAPTDPQDYHYEFHVPFELPEKWNRGKVWAKCDMIYAVGLHRCQLLRAKKDRQGKRCYILNKISTIHLKEIENCIMHSLGMGHRIVEENQ